MLADLDQPCTGVLAQRYVALLLLYCVDSVFLSHSAMLELDLAGGSMSIRLSVCPSHTGNASKLMIITV